jgi:hypothetical protein
VGFEPTSPAFERTKAVNALDRAATLIDCISIYVAEILIGFTWELSKQTDSLRIEYTICHDIAPFSFHRPSLPTLQKVTHEGERMEYNESLSNSFHVTFSTSIGYNVATLSPYSDSRYEVNISLRNTSIQPQDYTVSKSTRPQSDHSLPWISENVNVIKAINSPKDLYTSIWDRFITGRIKHGNRTWSRVWGFQCYVVLRTQRSCGGLIPALKKSYNIHSFRFTSG